MSEPAGERGTVEIMGVVFDRVTMEEACAHVAGALGRGEGGVIITPNLDHVRRAQHDLRFRRLIREADLVVADGMPIVWASRILGRALPERVAGSTLMVPLVERAAAAGRSVYLLGGNPGVAERAAEVLRERVKGVEIAGTRCPPLGFERDEGEMGAIRADLARAQPGLVLVALGSPKQEELIDAVREAVPGAWWIGIGIGLSFLTGDVARAPAWMQRMGVEWVHRLVSEPGRLARRYLVEGLPFAARLGWWALRGRVRPRKVMPS